jgi:tetratricopeptide (TPR) repeat protein
VTDTLSAQPGWLSRTGAVLQFAVGWIVGWLWRAASMLQAAFGWISKSISVSNIFAAISTIVGIIVCILVVQELSRDLVTIEPISVPRTLSDNGFTPEVASHRLLDAIGNFPRTITVNYSRQIDDIPSSMQTLNITPRDELQDFVVPTIGLSLNAIVSSIRSVLHSTNGQSISGEIVFHDNLAWLRLRVNGEPVFTNATGVAPENLDELLAAAAPAVIEKIKPYLAAVALYHDHPAEAAEKAQDIIDRVAASDANVRLKETDVNVEWSYILMGNYHGDRRDYIQAEKFLRKALALNWSNWTAHADLGNILRDQGKLDEAIRQYHRSIGINPASAAVHNNLGNVLSDKAKSDGKFDAAIAEYRRAIDLDRKYSLPHNNLGLALHQQGKPDEAIAEYRRAIAIDPKYAKAHLNLGNILHDRAENVEAAAEYRHAIDSDPKYASAHYDLAIALRAEGKLDDAIAEYQRTIEISPKYVLAYNNLGTIFYEQGKLDEAIAEYRRALAIDPKHTNAVNNLAKALRAKSAVPN